MKLKKDFNKLVFLLEDKDGKKKSNRYVVVDISTITDEDIMKNHYVFQKVLFLSDNTNSEYDKEDMKSMILSLDGFIYDILEEKHSNNPSHIDKKFKDYKAFMDRIYYNTKIYSNTSFKTIVDLEQEDEELCNVIRINLLYFFLSSLLSKHIQKTSTISVEKESQAYWLISCDIGEFLSFVKQ